MKKLVIRFLQVLPTSLRLYAFGILWKLRKLVLELRRYHPARLLRIFSGSSKKFGPPLGIIEIKGKVYEADLSLPALLKNVSEEVQFLHNKNSDLNMQPLEIITLEQARMVDDEGAVISAGDQLVSNISHQIGRCWGGDTAWRHDVFTRWKLGNIEKVTGSGASLCAPSGATYFHWLLDVLPRFYYLGAMNPDYWVIGELRHKFQRDALQLLGIEDKLIEMYPGSHVEFEKLHVLNTVNMQGTMRETVQFLRNTFQPKNGGVSPKRFFIDRAKASYRNVLYRDELLKVMQAYEIKPVFPEEMTFQEQVTLFSQAELVVAPHGSGLSNIAFCPSEATVVELFSKYYTNPIFYRLAMVVGMEYYAAIDGEDYRKHANEENLMADIGVTGEQLDKILCSIFKMENE